MSQHIYGTLIELPVTFFKMTQYNTDAHNTHAHSTLMSTSEGLSIGISGDSRSHQWRLVVDGNVAYDLTHNAGKT
jgi:hypothetical protein